MDHARRNRSARLRRTLALGSTMALVLVALAVGSSTSASAQPGEPTITINSPYEQAHYAAGSVVNASYSCTGDFQITSCTGDVANGSPIDTSTVGRHTFTVQAYYLRYTSSRSVNYFVDAAPGQIVIASPTNGGSYDRTAPPLATYSCIPGSLAVASCVGTDTWSTSTQSKKTAVPSGGRIPALVGKHVLSVVLTDTAGNTTTASRTFDIIIRHRPDAIINGLGDDIYANITPQTQTVNRGNWKIPIVVQNDGSVIDRYKFRGDHSQTVSISVWPFGPISFPGWKVRYFESKPCAGCVGAEITNQVVAGTYLTPAISPNRFRRYYIIVTATPYSAPVDRLLAVTDPTDSLSHDTVRVRLR